MKEKKLLKFSFAVNILVFVFTVFLFYQNITLKKKYMELHHYSKLLESKIELGANKLPSISLRNLNGYTEDLHLISGEKYVIFLASPIDCPPCFQNALDINVQARTFRNVNAIWLFFNTNLTELKNFLEYTNFDLSLKILLNDKPQSCKKIFGSDTPAIILTNGKNIKYLKKITGSIEEVNQILSEIELLFQ